MFKYSLIVLGLLIAGCGDNGCCNGEADIASETKSGEIVNLIPTAVIVPKSLECTVGESISYDGLTKSSDDGTISSYSWSIGDKVVSTNPKPNLICESLGEQEVCLTVTDDKGLQSNKECTKITVKSRPLINPIAKINGVDDTYTIGDTLSVDGSASSDSDGEVQSYSWSFGTQRSTEQKPTFEITTLGEQKICLSVRDNDDLNSTEVCENITVLALPNKRPTANFNPNEESLQCTQGETISLNAQSSSDSDGSIEKYEWNIGTLSGQTPAFSCDTVGDSSICLEVTDDGDLTSEEVCKNVLVSKKANKLPTARIFDLSPECTIGDQILLDGSKSSDEDGNVTNYQWIVDGSESTSEQKPILSCDKEGEKEICLVVTDNDGAKSENSACHTITGIAPVIPVPQTTPPVAVILFGEYRDDNAFIFDCSQSYDTDLIDSDNTPQNDKDATLVSWFVTKYYGGSEKPEPHPGYSCQKWIGVDSSLEFMDINLTVIDDDGETSSTIKRYTFEDPNLYEIEITD